MKKSDMLLKNIKEKENNDFEQLKKENGKTNKVI